MLILCAAGQLCASPQRAAQGDAEKTIRKAIEILRSGKVDARQRALAYAMYRRAVSELLPVLKNKAVVPEGHHQGEFFNPQLFSRITPVQRPHGTVSGLHREGLGSPAIGRVTPSRTADPNAPSAGYPVAVTALIVPGRDGGLELLLADPQRLETVDVFQSTFPVAMDLEAVIDAAQEAGPRFGDGLRYMLRSNRFVLPSQLVFFQPFDPAKTPVVLVHGLMSTPRMWKPVLKGLLAHKEIRERYQFWFFYYPTGQPVPFSALPDYARQSRGRGAWNLEAACRQSDATRRHLRTKE